MADFARFLPLSQRRAGDESGVTSDRRMLIADLVDEAARLIAASRPAIRHEGLAAGFVADAGLAPADPGDLAGLARSIRVGRRRGIRPLSTALGGVLRLAHEVGETAVVAPIITGAVSLHRSGAAPFDRRAVLSGHRVRASDDGWQFGFGPVLEGTGQGIAAFLLGLSDVPPQPVDRHRPAPGDR